MSTIEESRAGDNNPLEQLKLGLQRAVVGSASQALAHFSEAYPVIAQHLAANVSQKAALEVFNAAYGYRLHPPRFRKMLLDERKRRAATGDVTVCTACGQQLPHNGSTTEEVISAEGQ